MSHNGFHNGSQSGFHNGTASHDVNQELAGKVIVITGASSGFGKGAALAFAAAGASVVLAARREPLLDEVAQECQSMGVGALAVPTDVSRAEEVERLALTALSAFDRIDVWVNDAGVGALGRFEDIALADHAQVVATNLLGTIYGSYFAMRQFHKQGAGTLINIASALGKLPAPYYSSYTASKYGIVGLDGVLRQELAENKIENIHVCTVMPMAADTPFFDHAANYTGHELQPIPPVYDPRIVVDTIVRLATRPENEVTVGTMGVVMTAMHNIMPGTVEKMMGVHTHKVQMEDAPPASNGSGAVHEPMAVGTEVQDGWLNK
jgi:short-subunit dehydrogenase